MTLPPRNRRCGLAQRSRRERQRGTRICGADYLCAKLRPRTGHPPTAPPQPLRTATRWPHRTATPTHRRKPQCRQKSGLAPATAATAMVWGAAPGSAQRSENAGELLGPQVRWPSAAAPRDTLAQARAGNSVPRRTRTTARSAPRWRSGPWRRQRRPGYTSQSFSSSVQEHVGRQLATPCSSFAPPTRKSRS